MITTDAEHGETTMTSGQGQQGDPQGQPPGPPPWGQPGPYGPPSYGPPGQPGPPPYGQPGPSGQQPYGYAPMPSAGYGQPPPEPMERPLTVRAGLGAFMVSIVLGVASSLFAWANWDTFVDRAIAQQVELQDPDIAATGLDPAEFVEVFAVVFVVVGLVFTALHLLFVWLAWRGYNWARIVLWVLGALGILSGLSTLGGGFGAQPFPSLTALNLFSFAAVLAGVVLLAMKPSNEWFAHEKRRRALTPRR